MLPIAVPLLLASMALTSCETSAPLGQGHRPPPLVLVPQGLSAAERELLPEVEDALADAGFRVTHRAPADYQLDFEVDDGPVNADVHLRLARHDEEVAHAYVRVGGPRILVRRREVIRESFEKCLAQFTNQIHGVARKGWREFEPAQRDEYTPEPFRHGRVGGYERGY